MRFDFKEENKDIEQFQKIYEAISGQYGLQKKLINSLMSKVVSLILFQKMYRIKGSVGETIEL